MKSAHDLWEQLRDIPVDDNGYTQQKFLDFAPGTDREQIWRWFEETFDCSITEFQKAWKEPVSDARKYHLATLTLTTVKVHCTVVSEAELEAKIDEVWKNPLSTVYDRLIVIAVDPTGEIEIRPL
jgi:hypothetical protein